MSVENQDNDDDNVSSTPPLKSRSLGLSASSFRGLSGASFRWKRTDNEDVGSDSDADTSDNITNTDTTPPPKSRALGLSSASFRGLTTSASFRRKRADKDEDGGSDSNADASANDMDTIGTPPRPRYAPPYREDDDIIHADVDFVSRHRTATKPRLSIVHRNDKNDSESNMSFKVFRRSLSILKRSLNEADLVDFDFDGMDQMDLSNDDEVEESNHDFQSSEFSLLTDRSDHPSAYATGTSQRSMMGLGRKSNLPQLQGDSNKRKLEWLKSFYRLDPRWQICNFFDDLAHEGVERIDESGHIELSRMPFIMRAFSRVGVFSVWRPTSNEAIRRMITGEGTGKGMDIKGKSAVRGKWSGFVPFLQIHRDEDKLKIGSLRSDTRVRVFYPNEVSRNRAFLTLSMVRTKMVEKSQCSIKLIKEFEQKEISVLGEELNKSKENFSHESMKSAIGKSRRRLTVGPDAINYSEFEAALEAKHQNFMVDDGALHKIDDTQGHYGIDIPEKLFWETFVLKADICREDGSEYDSGRPSMPEFQVMNLESLRKAPKAGPRPVLWHAGCGKVGDEDPPDDYNPLNPFDLLMAYEEAEDSDIAGKVTPVVSDFDCFLVGTRRVAYRDPMGEQEQSMLKWCVDEIEGVLDSNSSEGGKSWTRLWLDVKKKYAFDPRFQAPMPKMGYADPRSKAMMKGAVYSLRQNGAVRHGPECFNYSFPQDLDDKFLVISDTLPGLVPWKYVDINELKEILAEKIDDGFAFPLNPKWVLCDEGWKDLYDKLLASEAPNVQDAMNVWYPADVRDRIAAISSKHPTGFSSREAAEAAEQPHTQQRMKRYSLAPQDRYLSNQHVYAEAELELERYKQRKKGMTKFRSALLKIKSKSIPKVNFVSTALLMIQVGRAVENIDEESRSKEVLDRMKCYVGESSEVKRSSIATAATTRSSVSGEMSERVEPRRSSLTRFVRKRLSSKKKMHRKSIH